MKMVYLAQTWFTVLTLASTFLNLFDIFSTNLFPKLKNLDKPPQLKPLLSPHFFTGACSFMKLVANLLTGYISPVKLQ